MVGLNDTVNCNFQISFKQKPKSGSGRFSGRLCKADEAQHTLYEKQPKFYNKQSQFEEKDFHTM